MLYTNTWIAGARPKGYAAFRPSFRTCRYDILYTKLHHEKFAIFLRRHHTPLKTAGIDVFLNDDIILRIYKKNKTLLDDRCTIMMYHSSLIEEDQVQRYGNIYIILHV